MMRPWLQVEPNRHRAKLSVFDFIFAGDVLLSKHFVFHAATYVVSALNFVSCRFLSTCSVDPSQTLDKMQIYIYICM